MVAASAYYADGLNRTLQEQQVRSAAARQSRPDLRTRLEGNINGNMQLVRGPVAVIEAQLQMTQTGSRRLPGRSSAPARNCATSPPRPISRWRCSIRSSAMKA